MNNKKRINFLKKIDIEFYLILFLFSGTLKDLYYFFFGIIYPIPLTIIFGALFIIMIFAKGNYNLSRIKSEFKKYIFLILFFLWALISITYSSSTNYYWYKLLALGTNYLAFIGVLLIQEIDIKKFVRYFFSALLFFFFIFFLVNPNSFSEEFVFHKYFNEKYIQGWYLILGQFFTANMFLVFLLNNKKQILYSLLISFNIILLLGARAPIFVAILILCVIILFLFISKSVTKNLLSSILRPVAFVLVLNGMLLAFSSSYVDLLSRSAYRMEVLSGGSNHENDNNSVSTRMDQYIFSKEKIFKNKKSMLIGYGIGSFSYEYTKEDKRLYPHNIVLEIVFELGFIGLFIVGCFLFVNISRHQMFAKNFILLAAVTLLLHAMKSSSFVDLRVLFCLLAICFFHGNSLKRT